MQTYTGLDDACNLVATIGHGVHYSTNNDDEYFERLTRTGPKRLHILYKYILSKFNSYNMNEHIHTHARVCVCVCVRARARVCRCV